MKFLPAILIPVAYLWTRTVKCKNPTCRAQPCHCSDRRGFAERRDPMLHSRSLRLEKKTVRFEVVESKPAADWDSTPRSDSKGGQCHVPVLRHGCR